MVATVEQVAWGQLFKHRNTWFMVLGAFGIFYTVWVYLTWLPSYLQTARGFSLADSGWLASLPFLCGIVGVVFGGFLGAAVAPIVTGYILNETGGNYTLVFLIGGALLIVGALSYGIFVKDRRAVTRV